MAFGMYAASVPAYQRQLTAISKVLDKAQAWAAARKVDEAVLLGTRMIPDMLPFSRQVMIACRFAEESVARLAGAEVPKAPEATEKNLGDLKARIAAVLAGIGAFKPEQIDGSEGRAVPHALCPAELLFPLHDHLRNLAAGRRRNRETGFHRWPVRLFGGPARGPVHNGQSP
jgi:hypothetical protein